ncbi:MAG: LacI family DNA-binding transcriptional regulator [Burkholderiales bacterium]|nr:LacI family DNA-binding transcriptional regulator [Opitutaceae bacterium]
MSDPKAITMRDLARLASCSANTISLALRDSPRLNSETRARIQELARRHGYRINPLVSAFVQSRGAPMPTQTIALLTKFASADDRQTSSTVFTLELLAGMAARAAEIGFLLEEFSTALPGAPDSERLNQILIARGIRGVILVPSGSLAQSFPALDWRHFSVVAAGFHARQWPVHRVALDQARSVELCLEQLTLRGYQRIGLAVTRDQDPRTNYTAAGAFLSWQLRQPERNRIPFIPVDHYYVPSDALEAWILEHRPEAVIFNDIPSIDSIDSINTRHGLNVIPLAINFVERPGLGGVVPGVAQLGKTSVSVLARELYLNHYGFPELPEVTLVCGQWREGERLRRLVPIDPSEQMRIHPSPTPLPSSPLS